MKRRTLAALAAVFLFLGLLAPGVVAPEKARAESWTQVGDGGLAEGFSPMLPGATASAVFNDGSGNHLYVGASNPAEGAGCCVTTDQTPKTGRR